MFTKEIHNFLIGLLFTLLIFSSTSSTADDTEIFFSRGSDSAQASANVLLMFDTSGSMLNKDASLNGTSRIEAVKQATVKLIKDSKNVNIGLGSFGGHTRGGTIRYPVVELDKDVCENLTCDSIQLLNRVENANDDAEENNTGEMRLDGWVKFGGDVLTGLRFDNIKIPRGAQLTSARLELTPTDTQDSVTDVQISAEAIGHSPLITDDLFDLSSRTRTLARANWIPQPFDKHAVYGAELLPVVSEVVGRADWCGGNALTLLVEGTGSRSFYNSDASQGRQAVLKLAYDPGTVDFNDTCLTQDTLIGIGGSNDDAVETMATGVVDTLGGKLLTEAAGELNLVGLRFNSVEIPQTANIINAKLKLQSKGFAGNKLSATVFGEAVGDSAPFNDTTPFGISSRTPTAVSVNWNDIDQLIENNILESPDLSSVVQEIVSQGDWTSGNSLSIMLEPDSNVGAYLLGAFEDEDAQSAQLLIEYQVDESTLAGNPVVLKTARDELLDEVLDLRVGAFTPLVDLLYEAALYYRGAPLHYGAARGLGISQPRNSIQRVAHEDSYIGGVVFRPPDCSEVDLNSIACAGEKINGAPVYQAPETSACLANNIVMLTDGAAVKNSAKELVKELTGVSTCADRADDDEECGLELATWLYETDHEPLTPGDQEIKVHTIGFNFSSNFLSDVASLGGGQFHPVENANALSNAFQEIVTTAADISTSFVAPTVAVSQLNTLTNSDEIYYAMFKPELTTKWDGNLKRYSLGAYNGETAVVDALGVPAIDHSTGSISATAQSYWSGFKDGDQIAEGGAASQLPQLRSVYTFQPGAAGANSLQDFHETNTYLNATTLDLADNSYLTELVQWARGVDVKDFDSDGNFTEVRAQMGDPLHSIPYVINYAEEGGTESVIFVGTNEGFLHAIDTESGVEEYAIIPPELLPNLDAYYRNEAVEEHGRIYGLDGDVIGWIDDVNGNRVVDNNESAFVVVGMRRGGANYYAFDVSDRDNPEVAWVIRNTDSDFAELGQTWSRPIKSKLKVGGVATDVLIFSGGYDTYADIRVERTDVANADTKGRAIFIVNAETGDLITRFDNTSNAKMDYSIPSNPRVIDINFDGLADYLFVGDTGGQVWRLDFINATSDDDFEIYGDVIADFGTIGTFGNRRFYYEPDIAVLTDENGRQYLNIAIGSGWRASPLNKLAHDRMYIFRDYALYGAPRDESNDVDYPFIDEGDLYNATHSDTDDDTTELSQNGFYIEMVEPGEKILSSAFTVNSNLLFTSYLPSADSTDPCQAAVGSSHFYAINARNGKSILDLDGTLSEEGASELDISDRKIILNAPGIAPSPNVLLPGGGLDPLVLVGLEKPEGSEGLDIGNSFKQTFWAQPESIE